MATKNFKRLAATTLLSNFMRLAQTAHRTQALRHEMSFGVFRKEIKSL
jgi:hypothetical protein